MLSVYARTTWHFRNWKYKANDENFKKRRCVPIHFITFFLVIFRTIFGVIWLLKYSRTSQTWLWKSRSDFMNSIPPRNDWNNGAIYPFLMYNGRLRVKLFSAYIWKSLLLNAAFLKLLFCYYWCWNMQQSLVAFSSYGVLLYVVYRQVISNNRWFKIIGS